MSFTLKRGLKNIYVAEVLEDSVEKFTTGTPEKLIPAGEMGVEVDSDKSESWFDDALFATIGREGGSTVTISGAGLRAAAIAKLNAKTIDEETGAVIDSGEYTEKYWAVGAEKGNIDGTVELVWFMKGIFAIPGETAKTKTGDDTDSNGTELEYTANKTIHQFTKTKTGCKRVVIDTETTKVKADADWFKQVVTPDNLATICEKVTAAATT